MNEYAKFRIPVPVGDGIMIERSPGRLKWILGRTVEGQKAKCKCGESEEFFMRVFVSFNCWSEFKCLYLGVVDDGFNAELMIPFRTLDDP
jgi:hypothetical protein